MARTRRKLKKKVVENGENTGPPKRSRGRPIGSTKKKLKNKSPQLEEEDEDFELTAEMMVHDFDDETTIREEEQLSDSAYMEELANLEKDNQLSIDELREQYSRLQEKYEQEQKIAANKIKKSVDAGEIEDDDEYIPKKSYYQSDKKNNKNSQFFENKKILPSRSRRLASRQLPNYFFRRDFDDYLNGDDSRDVKIGDSHQAYTAPIYYTLDAYPLNTFPVHKYHLQWSPYLSSTSDVNNYFTELNKNRAYAAQPSEDFALAHLTKYDCSIDLAIRNIDELVVDIDNSHLNWSLQDCENFEKGISVYGKHFLSIQQNYLPLKPYCEIIQFYYSWKKSERADRYMVKLKENSKSKRSHASVFDYLGNVMTDKKLPYKLCEDGVHYEIDDTD